MTHKTVVYKYGTGNPVEPNGSGDVRDGIDNLQSFDVFMNAEEDTYNQRDGQIVQTAIGAVRSLGFKHGAGDFTTGFTVQPGQRDYAWYDPVSKNWYSWLGVIPASGYVVSPGTNPVGDVNWKPVTDQLLRDDLSLQSGSSLVGFIQSGSGSVQRTAQDKMRDEVSIKDFGAVADGVTPANAAVNLMIADLGFARFTIGNYALNTDTFDSPLHFDAGAYITIPSSNTVTITARITSPNQWIFRGNGTVLIGNDDDSGEESRVIHASWFGAVTAPLSLVDQAPAIQRAINSLGNAREGAVEFDNGNYHIFTPMTVGRGVHIIGKGARRTVFRVEAGGFDVFTTAGVAAKFSHIQFEPQGPGITKINGKCIAILHGECEVYDWQVNTPVVGVYVEANNARIENCGSIYGEYPGVGSALVQLASGSGHRVADLYGGTSVFGPDTMVKIGGGGSVSGFSIENVNHIVPAQSVVLDASAGNILRGTIDSIIYNGTTGTAPLYSVDIINPAANNISDISVSDVTVAPYASNGIRVLQNGSGTTEDILFNNVNVSGASGKGFDLVQSAGILRTIKIGDTIDVSERAIPVSYSGVMSEVRVSPMALVNTNHAMCYDFTIADDSVAVINLQRSVFSSVLAVTAGSVNFGQWVARSAATPAITQMFAPSANVVGTTGALTGTTGTDGKLTVSVDDKFIYVENRLGSSQRVEVIFMTGIA